MNNIDLCLEVILCHMNEPLCHIRCWISQKPHHR